MRGSEEIIMLDFTLDERNQTFGISCSYAAWIQEGYKAELERKLHEGVGKYLMENLPQNEWTAIRPAIQWPTEKELYIAKVQWDNSIDIPSVTVRVRFEFLPIPQSDHYRR